MELIKSGILVAQRHGLQAIGPLADRLEEMGDTELARMLNWASKNLTGFTSQTLMRLWCEFPCDKMVHFVNLVYMYTQVDAGNLMRYNHDISTTVGDWLRRGPKIVLEGPIKSVSFNNFDEEDYKNIKYACDLSQSEKLTLPKWKVRYKYLPSRFTIGDTVNVAALNWARLVAGMDHTISGERFK